ncbi:MAG: hypothetical protein H6923_02380 [Alphaproteobacteria bacterium]|nr:hypothetical protein [Alphaproteobacteria bacterium]
MRFHIHHPVAQTGLALILLVSALALAASPAMGRSAGLWVLSVFACVNPLLGYYAVHWWRYTLVSVAGLAALSFAHAAVVGLLGGGLAGGAQAALLSLRVPLLVYACAVAVTGAARFAAIAVRPRRGRDGAVLETLVPEPVLYSGMVVLGLVIGSASFLGAYRVTGALSARGEVGQGDALERTALVQLVGEGKVGGRRLALGATNATPYVITEITILVKPAEERPLPAPLTVTRDFSEDPWMPGARLDDTLVLPPAWEGLSVTWSVESAQGAPARTPGRIDVKTGAPPAPGR